MGAIQHAGGRRSGIHCRMLARFLAGDRAPGRQITGGKKYPSGYQKNRATTNIPIMDKANATFNATPSTKPMVAPNPARAASSRLRWADSSPMTAPINGPNKTPGKPRKNPTRMPARAPIIARLEAPNRFAPNIVAQKSTPYVRRASKPRIASVHLPTKAKFSTHAATNSPAKISGAPGIAGRTTPAKPVVTRTMARSQYKRSRSISSFVDETGARIYRRCWPQLAGPFHLPALDRQVYRRRRAAGRLSCKLRQKNQDRYEWFALRRAQHWYRSGQCKPPKRRPHQRASKSPSRVYRAKSDYAIRFRPQSLPCRCRGG